MNALAVTACREVSRAELKAALQANKSLLDFLMRAACVKPEGGEAAGAETALSVFDRIERDDNDTLSWEEFKGYFQSTGALASSAKQPTSVNTYALLRCTEDHAAAQTWEVRAACTRKHAAAPGVSLFHYVFRKCMLVVTRSARLMA
jgi:hypothetical protein